MLSLYDVPAPAKLNLFLHITGQRPDGYHLLQSAFMLIDWHDSLHFELRTSATVSREDLTAALPTDDLCTRAARALQAATGCTQGVHIGVHKRVPAQAGMGGGSSDAASTLLALNRLWKLNLTRTQLQAIGVQLGADVPFFLSPGNAWVEGIGDIIRPLEAENSIPAARFVVIKPATGLDTKAIFSNPALERNFPCATISGFAAKHFHFGENALQPVAKVLCPQVDEVMQWLSTKGLQARMTGSGSAVFAHITHDVDLLDAPGAWQIRMCENLQNHPLADWVSD